MQMSSNRPFVVRTSGPLANRWPPGQPGAPPPLGADRNSGTTVVVHSGHRSLGSGSLPFVSAPTSAGCQGLGDDEVGREDTKESSSTTPGASAGSVVAAAQQRYEQLQKQAADALTSRVDEALSRLTQRIDQAVSELRTEVPQLRREDEAQRAILANVSDDLARISQVSNELRNEVPQLRLEDESQRSMLTSMSKAHDSLAHRVEAMEHSLAEEIEARSDLEKALGKDLREGMLLELERLRDSVMREMRERMDGQKVLREEVQLQQGSLMRLTSKIDESLVELRTELPSIKGELVTQKTEMERMIELQSSGGERLDAIERGLSDESEVRIEDSKAMYQDMQACLARDIESLRVQLADLQNLFEARVNDSKKMNDDRQTSLAREIESLGAQLADVQKLLEEQRCGAAVLNTSMKEALTCVEQLTREARVQRDSVDVMSTQLRETRAMSEQQAQQAADSLSLQLQAVKSQSENHRSTLELQLSEMNSDLRCWADGKLQETENCVRSWVESTMMSRVNSLDKALRKEMTERASTNQQVLDKITHNSERWCQLQAKFDELLVEVHKTVGHGVVRGTTTPRGSHVEMPSSTSASSRQGGSRGGSHVNSIGQGIGDHTSLSSSSTYLSMG